MFRKCTFHWTNIHSDPGVHRKSPTVCFNWRKDNGGPPCDFHLRRVLSQRYISTVQVWPKLFLKHQTNSKFPQKIKSTSLVCNIIFATCSFQDGLQSLLGDLSPLHLPHPCWHRWLSPARRHSWWYIRHSNCDEDDDGDDDDDVNGLPAHSHQLYSQ